MSVSFASLSLLSLLLYCIVADGQLPPRHTDGKTLLKLRAADIQVNTEAQLSLDSTQILAARYFSISPVSVITEGMNDAFCASHSKWMDHGYVDSATALLPLMGAADRTELRLLIGAWFAFQPGNSNYRKAIFYLEQVLVEAKRLGRREWEAQAYCLLSKSYYMMGDTLNGKKWYASCVDRSDFIGMTDIQARVRSYAGMYCPFMPQTHRFRLDCLSQALVRYRQLKDTGNQVNTLMDISYMSFAAGDVHASEEAAMQSLQLLHDWKFPYTQYCYDLLAYLKDFKGEYGASLSMALSALKATESTGDRWFLPRAYYRVSGEFELMQNRDDAFRILEKAIQAEMGLDGDMALYWILDKMSVYTNDIKWGPGLLSTIRHTLARYPPTNPVQRQLVLADIGHCYENMNDLVHAKYYYEQAWKMEPEVSKIKGGMKSIPLMYDMGWINFRTGDYSKSKKYLTNLLSMPFAKEVDRLNLLSIYEAMYKVDSIQGDYRSALHYLYLHDRQVSSVDDRKEMKEVEILRENYRSLQREKEVAALQAESRMVQQKDRMARKFYYAGFAVLGFFIVMIYIRYYNNKKKNRQLRAQKEEIDRQNIALQQMNRQQTLLIDEKEWLLREIHHRVKNNLQIITSLLLSQSEYLRDQSAVNIMMESQRRIQAMSLIHQKLYNSENLSSINMPAYIGELVDYLRESFDRQHKVLFRIRIGNISLDVSKVVPLGLILNEAITNAFKYAFPCSDEDCISILLTRDQGQVLLEVLDNGKGLRQDFDHAASNSFGIVLMRGMAEDLEGTLSIGPADTGGVRVVLHFSDLTANTFSDAIS